MTSADLVIVGGGIVGLATAYRFLKRWPQRSVIVLEKEAAPARHQSAHNSGVLHSGIYYKPGSLKAAYCREGKKALEAFCAREGIEVRVCGKVIVATQESELPALMTLYERGRAGKVHCDLIDSRRLRALEPHAAGIRAIHVPEAGIVDFRRVCRHLAARLEEGGGRIISQARVTGLEELRQEVRVESTRGEFRGRFLLNCAGLQADRLATLGNVPTPARILPFRGEYYKLTPAAAPLCRTMIYPVPDPRFPFLGVHLTRTLAGEVKCGPNAVLAWAREGYDRWQVNPQDVWEILTYPGFIRLAARYWRTGLKELWRSCNMNAFLKSVRSLVPEIAREDLLPAAAGVRAQAVTRDGRILDDFCFLESRRLIHVLNAPSPGATASLSLGQALVEKLSQRF
uniref:L-2-hydroxyglutarate oxidase n=1 Tax=Desulfobacca acetoxidans TaxID=60893 RepID=A0A7C3Z8E0_9BACT